MARVALLLSIALTSGACSALFGLETVGLPPDGRDCGTADEDADGIADGCDVCPGIADVAQADSDADGVGDACDPSSSIANTLVHFEGFNAADDAMTRWRPVDTSVWTFGDGSVVHELSDVVGELQYAATETAVETTVEAGFTFSAWGATTNQPQLGVRLDAEELVAAGHSCRVEPYNNDDPNGDQAEVFEAGGGGRPTPIPAIAPGQNVVVRGTRTMTSDVLRCQVLVDGVEVASLMYAGVSTFPPAGHVAVMSPLATSVVRYVAVYASR